jgi:hypothetical protein
MRQLQDFTIKVNHIPLLCDNENTIKITNNTVQHSHMMISEVNNHVLMDLVEMGNIDFCHGWIGKQLEDIFSKPLEEKGSLSCAIN